MDNRENREERRVGDCMTRGFCSNLPICITGSSYVESFTMKWMDGFVCSILSLSDLITIFDVDVVYFTMRPGGLKEASYSKGLAQFRQVQ